VVVVVALVVYCRNEVLFIPRSKQNKEWGSPIRR